MTLPGERARHREPDDTRTDDGHLDIVHIAKCIRLAGGSAALTSAAQLAPIGRPAYHPLPH